MPDFFFSFRMPGTDLFPGAWISLAGIVLGLAVFYDKRFGLVFLAVPLILFFTMDRWQSVSFLFFRRGYIAFTSPGFVGKYDRHD